MRGNYALRALTDGALCDKMNPTNEAQRSNVVKKELMSPEHLEKMLEEPLLVYPAEHHINDNRLSTLDRTLALYSLVLYEHECGEGGAFAARAAEHLASATTAGQAPSFDATCHWNYAVLSASIALARQTPTIWSLISSELAEKLDFAMELFAYLESFATSDENIYRTGPGLKGNYHKGWNPNFRLANAPVMLYAAHYFGLGDMTLGAKRVNDMLHGFDEAKYDEVIARLDAYGWHRAKATWTTPARVHEDGTSGTDARHVLLYGGETYSLDYTHTRVMKDGGNGAGVTCGGKDYAYHEHTLTEADKIIEDLLTYNYSGGEVRSDHHHDVDHDGVEERIAWIVDESHSPYEGQLGMMLEFASGNRSSTTYCAHDFVLTTVLISAAIALGIHDVRKNEELWSMITVGNEDFLYKNERGYQCYATGSYGISAKSHSEENEDPPYFAMKSLWRTFLK